MPPVTPRKEAARKLAAAANTLQVDADRDDETIKQDLANLDEARRSFARIFHGRSSASVSDFFKAVGLGVRSAQEELDKQAAEDARARVEQEMALRTRAPGLDASKLAAGPATMFRIPRVTAELKYTLETVRESGFDLLVYSDTEKQSEQQQQTIQLEIVAAPVPPDYINTLRQLAEKPGDGGGGRGAGPTRPRAPAGGFEAARGMAIEPRGADIDIESRGADVDTDDMEGAPVERAAAPGRADPWAAARAGAVGRAEARSILEIADTRVHGERRTLVKRLLLPNWERAIVLDDKRGGYFVLLAMGGKRPEMALWQVVPETGSVRLLHRLRREPAMRRLHDFVVTLCDALSASQRD